MNNPTMLYRCPGPHKTEGVSYEYTIVDDSEVEAAKADGWHSDWMQADAAFREAEAASQAPVKKAKA